jgi:hypothetical protein
MVRGAAAVAAEPVDYYQRRRAASRYNQLFPSNQMPVDDGYALLPAGSLPGTSDIVDTCRRLFVEKKATLGAAASTAEQAAREQRSKRSFLFNLLDDDDLRTNPGLIDFALSDPLFSIVTNYFGTIPSLAGVNLIYSIPRLTPDKHISSQLFHWDPEGVTQAKVFLNIFDVDEEHGPFTFIPARQSERIVPTILRQRRQAGVRSGVRYHDEEVKAQGGMGAVVRLLGPTGTAAIADTSRCLHAGSRLQPGHFRLCLFLQYRTSDHSANSFEARRFRDDPVRWLALKRTAVLE